MTQSPPSSSTPNEVLTPSPPEASAAPRGQAQVPGPTQAQTLGQNAPSLQQAYDTLMVLRERLRSAVMGRDDVIDLVLIALIADGHVLLEDFPGSGKTTLARALGDSLSSSEIDGIAPFRRIQFTPDLLPSDITGTNVFDVDAGGFEFRRGPVFSHIVLADEINRTSPKVQAAMLEAMGEKQVTVDDRSIALDEFFFVIATQNPVDLAGTYPLPTPQLDRFLFKIKMHHIDRESELAVLATYPRRHLDEAKKHRSLSRRDILGARAASRYRVNLVPEIRHALVDLARSLRSDDRVLQGASTRSLVLFLPALQARALLHRRDHVIPEDVEALAPHVFRHRLQLSAGGGNAEAVVRAHLGPILEALARHSQGRL